MRAVILSSDICNLGKVASTMDHYHRGPIRYAFNIIGVQGRPLVNSAFDTQEEAESAHKPMQGVVASAKLIKRLGIVPLGMRRTARDAGELQHND